MVNSAEWLAKCLDLCVNVYSKTDCDNEQGFAEIERLYNLLDSGKRQEIINILENSLESKDIIFVCSCIMAYTNIREIEDYVTDVICKAETDIETGIMYETMLRIYGKYIGYRKIRALHKKNVQMISDKLELHYEYMPLSVRNRKRIIIATEQILSQLHAPTKIVCEYAYVLEKMLGYEVIIVVAPSDIQLGLELWYRPRVLCSVESPTNSIDLIYRDITLRIYQVRMTEGINKYSDFFQIINEFKPYFVINLGVLNPVADIFSYMTNVVAIAMSTGYPVSEADILVKKGNGVDDDVNERVIAGQKCIYVAEKYPIVLTENTDKVDYDKYDLPKDKFIISVVGNRLNDEIDADFEKVIKWALENFPQTVVVFVGPADSILEHFNVEVGNQRVIGIEFCKELMEFYNCVDLYLNPRRSGGGVSSVMALNAGVPVVTLPDCDVAVNVGKNYEVSDFDKMKKEISKYINDSEYYEKQSLWARKSVEGAGLNKVNDYVKKLIDKIKCVIEESDENDSI